MFTFKDYQNLFRIKNIMKKNPEGRIILFLDFDGVINAGISLKDFVFKELPCGFYDLSNHDCVKRVNQLIHDYSLSIVLSTSWRATGMEKCYAYLTEIGFDQDIDIVGMTALDKGVSREEVIMDYLLEHPSFRGFLILDDITMEHLKYFQVVTNFQDGYSEACDAKAREILSSF